MKLKFKKELLLLCVFLSLGAYIAADHFGVFNGRVQVSENKIGTATVNGGIQEITTVLNPRSYEPITVQVGIPVKWTIKAEQGAVNGCNDAFEVPAYGIRHGFSIGDNVIEFTPDEVGTFPYACWMGMIRSSITVVEKIS